MIKDRRAKLGQVAREAMHVFPKLNDGETLIEADWSQHAAFQDFLSLAHEGTSRSRASEATNFVKAWMMAHVSEDCCNV
jgi:hypothetical protein